MITINALSILLVLIVGNKKTGYYFERLIVKLPIYGKLYTYFLTSYLSQILKLLLDQKYSVLDTFKLCRNLFNGPFFNREMDEIYEKLQNGYSLGQCFEESKLFPEFMAQLIKDGEKTGTLKHKVGTIADLFKSRLRNHIDWVLKMIQPTFFIITNDWIIILCLRILLANLEKQPLKLFTIRQTN